MSELFSRSWGTFSRHFNKHFGVTDPLLSIPDFAFLPAATVATMYHIVYFPRAFHRQWFSKGIGRVPWDAFKSLGPNQTGPPGEGGKSLQGLSTMVNLSEHERTVLNYCLNYGKK